MRVLEADRTEPIVQGRRLGGLQPAVQPKDFTIVYSGPLTGGTDLDDFGFRMMHTGQVANIQGISDPEVDRITEKVQETFDREPRKSSVRSSSSVSSTRSSESGARASTSRTSSVPTSRAATSATMCTSSLTAGECTRSKECGSTRREGARHPRAALPLPRPASLQGPGAALRGGELGARSQHPAVSQSLRDRSADFPAKDMPVRCVLASVVEDSDSSSHRTPVAARWWRSAGPWPPGWLT